MARAGAAAPLAGLAALWLATRGGGGGGGGGGPAGACGAAFLRGSGLAQPAAAAPGPGRGGADLVVLALALSACGAAYGLHRGWRAKKLGSLRRPYVIPDLHRAPGADWPRDPSAELSRIFGFIQDVVLRPLNDRLPGRPFEYDFQSFPFTPTVLVIGNHSSGKSTFINSLLGKGVQGTGVAPTDDCFTVLERHQVDQQEDGPTVLGCPENRPFADLRKFGQIFSGHLRRKRVLLPDDSRMPFGLQIVDTPGMIDLPASDGSFRGRGYNFVDVARWWAKRSDLILLFFDPDKPGTTGETLEVLTKSLQGLHHKSVIVLNKLDKVDNSADLARTYGALSWALSKVIQGKDIPQLFTVLNEGFDGHACAASSDLPLEAFSRKREELVDEVLRVRERHNDNIITALDETLCQVEMVCAVVECIRAHACRRRRLLHAAGAMVLLTLALGAAQLLTSLPMEPLGAWARLGILAAGLPPCIGGALLLWGLGAQHRRLLRAGVDGAFRECYARHFVHRDGEDVEYRWQVVSPKVRAILDSVPCLSHLPRFEPGEVARIQDCLEKDIWYLRQIARRLRDGRRPEAAGRPQRAAPCTESLDRAAGGGPPRAEAAARRAPDEDEDEDAEGAPEDAEEAFRQLWEDAEGARRLAAAGGGPPRAEAESPDRAAGSEPPRAAAACQEAFRQLWQDAEKARRGTAQTAEEAEQAFRRLWEDAEEARRGTAETAEEAEQAFRRLWEDAEEARRGTAQTAEEAEVALRRLGEDADEARRGAAQTTEEAEAAFQRLGEDAEKEHSERAAAAEAPRAKEGAAEEARRAQESPDRAAGDGPPRAEAAGRRAPDEDGGADHLRFRRLWEDAEKEHAERRAAEEARRAQELAQHRAAEEARRAQEHAAERRAAEEARRAQEHAAERRAEEEARRAQEHAEEARGAVRQAAEEARRARQDFERILQDAPAGSGGGRGGDGAWRRGALGCEGAGGAPAGGTSEGGSR